MNRRCPQLLGAILWLCLCQISTAQCPTVEAILVDACSPSAESQQEFLILQSGAGFAVDEFGIRTPSNVSPANSDLGVSGNCPFVIPNTTIASCPNLVLAGPGDVVPADALVIVWMSGAFDPSLYDWSAICNLPQAVYLLQNSCNRTAGAFVNSNCGNCNPRSIELETLAGCSETFTYDPLQLIGGDGAYISLADIALYGNNGCAVPPVRVPMGVDCSSFESSIAAIERPCSVQDAIGINTDSSGIIEVTATGGQGPYTFAWLDTTAVGPTLSNLTTGNYAAVATDAQGCLDTATFILNPSTPTSIEFLDSSTPPNCQLDSSGQIHFRLNGSLPISYRVLDPNRTLLTDSVLSINDPVAERLLTQLDTGTYYVALIDSAGCTASDSIRFDAPVPPTVLLEKRDPTCAGDSTGQLIALPTGIGPFSFDWGTPELFGDTINRLDTGIYTLVLTDSTGCSVSRTDTLTGLPQPTLSFSGPSVLCSDDCLELPTNTSGNAPFGIRYDLVNANGVRQAQFFQSDSSTDTLVFCPASLGLVPGNYSLNFQQLSDASCLAALDTNHVFELLPSAVGAFQTTICQGASITINGTVYDAANPSGQEQLVGAASNGCDSVVQITLEFYPEARGTFAAQLCPGESLTIGGTVFNEANPNGMALLPNASVNGCDSVVQVDLSFRAPIETTVQEMLCADESLTVGSQTFSRSRPRGQVVLQSLVTGCDSTISVELSFFDQGRIRLFGGLNSCEPSSVNLPIELTNVSAVNVLLGDDSGRTFAFDNVTNTDSLRVPGDRSGIYSILRADNLENGCPLQTSGSAVLQISRLQLSVEGIDTYNGFGISCAGASDGALSSSAEGGIPPYSFQWNTGDNASSISNLAAGNYLLTVTDGLGCSQEVLSFIEGPAPMQLIAEGLPPVCNDQRGVIRLESIIGGSGSYEYRLADQEFEPLSFPDSSIVRPGTYPIFLLDGNGCTASDTITVPQGNPLRLFLPPDQTISVGDSVELVARTDFLVDSVFWEPAELFSAPNSLRTTARPIGSTLVSMTVLSPEGCVVSGALELRVESQNPLYVPNIFSPNNDGRNDTFRFFAGEGVTEISSLRIWSRWGNLVFEAGPGPIDDPSMSWDGTFRGEAAKSDVYLYLAEVVLLNGQTQLIQGDVVLVR